MIKRTIAGVILVIGLLIFISGNALPAIVLGVTAVIISLDSEP